MKKILLFILIAALILAVVGCGKPKNPDYELIADIDDFDTVSYDDTSSEPEKEKYESEELKVYGETPLLKNSFKKVYTENMRMLIETNDGKLYNPINASENLLEGCDVQELIVDINGHGYKDSTGMYHLFGYKNFDNVEVLCHDFVGKIKFFFYSSFTGQMCVISTVDNTLYYTAFDKTGAISSEKEHNAKYVFQRFTGKGLEKIVYEKYDSFDIVTKNTGLFYIATIDGKLQFGMYTGVDSAGTGKPSITISSDYGDMKKENIYDIKNLGLVYSKQGVEDKLFYEQESKEFFVNLPEEHKLSELSYFNYGTKILMSFDNGDVYIGDTGTSILGENVTLDEELTKLNKDGHIKEIFDYNYRNYVLMDDNVIYEVVPTAPASSW